MEELLNKLIEKGWKPFGKDYEEYANGCLIYSYKGKFDIFSVGKYPTTYRELVSKESNLWQFVCENGMAKGIMKLEDYPLPRETNKKVPTYKEWTKQQRGEGKQGDCVGAYPIDNYGYRLIESALKDESELEKFLLNSIKLD